MNISKTNIKLIIDEIKTVRKLMKEEANIEKKVYYYSAVHGIVDRIMKLEYDPVLNFTHFIFVTTHSTIANHIQQMKAGIFVMPIEPDFFDKLDKLLDEFVIALQTKNDSKIHWVLNKVVCLTSTILGPQYYMQKKGIKVVPD